MKLIDEFLSDLEAAQGVKAKKISVAEEWKQTAPSEVDRAPLDEYFKDVQCPLFTIQMRKTDISQVGVRTFCYGLYHALDDFRNEYHQKYGREPYVNPVTRWRWYAALYVQLYL
jgi:hypothetical protein